MMADVVNQMDRAKKIILYELAQRPGLSLAALSEMVCKSMPLWRRWYYRGTDRALQSLRKKDLIRYDRKKRGWFLSGNFDDVEGE